MRLVRVVAPHFIAGFETNGHRVMRCAPILRRKLLNKSEKEARQIIKQMGWVASVIP